MKKIYFSILFLFLVTLQVSAQDQVSVEKLKFKLLTIDDGLSQGLVSAIIQDSRGFLWFGTKDGLNKYDGYSFKVYRNDPADNSSIAQNHIEKLFEDKRGLIWIWFNTGGLDIFNPETEFSYHVEDFNKEIKKAVPLFSNVCSDKNGAVYLGNYYYLFKIDLIESSNSNLTDKFPYGLKITALHDYLKDYKISINQFAFTITKANELWIAQFDSIFIFSNPDISSPRKVLRLINPSQMQRDIKLSDSRFLITTDHTNHRLVITYQNIFVIYDINTHTVLDKYEIEGKGIILYSASFDRSGKLWLGEYFNLFRYNPETRKLLKIEAQDPYISKDILRSCYLIYEDNNGVKWIGTSGFGVLKLNSAIDRFNHVSGVTGKSFSIVGAVEDLDHKIIVITNSGLCLYNRKTREIEANIFQKKFGDNITTFFADVYRNQYITLSGFKASGTYYSVFDKEKRFVKKHELTHDGKSIDIANTYVDNKNRLWLFADMELPIAYMYLYDTTGKDKVIKKYNFPVEGSNNSYRFVSSVIDDERGNLWIGTNKGLFQFNPWEEKWKHFVTRNGDSTALPLNVIFSLCKDPADSSTILWIGTNGGGLVKFNMQTGLCNTYNKRNGLPNDVIYGILSDNKNNLWLSTNQGIARFNPETKAIKTFTVNDGLQSNEFNRYASLKLQSGELFFGGVNGFNIFNPDLVNESNFNPEILITGFKVNNQEVSPGSKEVLFSKLIFATDKIKLDYKQNLLSFEFTSTDYSVVEKNLFQYMLEGLDRDWSPPSAAHSATYTNLDPGEYVFKVKGTNSDGKWSEKTASLSISITPPFWKTWWFYTLSAFLFILLFLFYLRLKTQSLLKQQDNLEKMVYSRTKELRKEKVKVEQQSQELEKTLKDLRSTQSQLVQQEKMASLGQLTAGVAHEINNPINFVSANINPLKRDINEIITLLEKYSALDEKDYQNKLHEILKFKNQIDLEYTINEIKSLLTGIEEGSKRTAEIVKNLRNFSRIDEEEMKYVNINEGIESTLLLLKNKLNQHNIEMIRSLGTIPEFECHPGQLNQVFMNLITNAIDAVLDNGKIFVTTSKENNRIKISIRDTGHGMSEEVRCKIFDPFFTTKDVGKGTGLGLSISYNIIEKHGGKIEVSSEVGKGTEFIIFLPVV